MASVALCFVVPRFIESVRKQGATPDVMDRLYFFSEMNVLRTFFRVLYAVAFVSLP